MKRTIAIVAGLAAAIVVVIIIVFANIISEYRVEVGDYTVAIDRNTWTNSIGQDGSTLVLMRKDNNLSGIGMLPYAKGVTYDLLNQEGGMESLINELNNVQFESQSEQTINNTRCIVVNIKYKEVDFANDKAIKAFCEGKDGTMFLLEVEGVDQAELDSNLSTGVKIINTAKHK